MRFCGNPRHQDPVLRPAFILPVHRDIPAGGGAIRYPDGPSVDLMVGGQRITFYRPIEGARDYICGAMPARTADGTVVRAELWTNDPMEHEWARIRRHIEPEEPSYE